jgi:carbon-monoxide dehydrogenase large subunit
MPDSAIGTSLPRLEDARLLTGGGCYSDDFTLPGQAYAWVVRSPYPHVRIVAVDPSVARAMPGVLAVLTGADVAADGLKPVPHIPAAMSPPDIKLPNTDGSPHRVVRPDVLAIETACFVGEGVAFVVAETLAIAKDAAEAVQVDYEALPPLADVVVESLVGDPAGTQAAFAQARHVVKLRTEIQRVTGVPMEPRAALGHFDAASGRYTLYAGGGAIVRPKKEVAIILGIEPEQVRVIAKEVGGNFGTRNFFYPEFALVCWASRRIGRPVKWTCERHEAFLSDYAGRDFLIESELALDADGSFLGLRATSTSNLGAYTASFVPLTKGTQLMTSLYRMPAMARARGSIGTPVTALDEVLKLADWSGFGQRQAETAARGLRRGIGLGGYVESQSGAPAERAQVTVLPEGLIEIVIGTLSSGQGHATSFAQLASEWLGVPADKVRLVTDDSDRVSVGGGSHSGRSIRLAATTIHQASLGIIEQGRKLAAQLLEAAEADIAFADGRFTIAGTDRGIGLLALAAERGPIADQADVDSRVGSYPYGWHVCEVEVDAGTGVARIDRYTTIDDVGRAVNPLILHGQTHGGIAQGAGQALMERCFYAPDGQLLSGSFMDYAMPHADDFPSFATALSEVPSTNHPLGFRGGGEGGITPALGVIINAVVDALADLGVTHIDMPASPERVWRAIREARRAL